MSGKTSIAFSLVGRQFGLLSVLSVVRVNGRLVNHVVCSCGNERYVKPSNLLRPNGNVSCGCYKRDLAVKHEMCNSPEYKIWGCIVQRCCNPSNSRFDDYGGRGVTVCENWRDSFVNFLNDMGCRPSPKHSIDRVDNDKGYEHGNCQWSLPEAQMNNTRRNRYVEFNGVTKTVSEWAKHIAMSYGTLSTRLNRGWKVKDALTKKVQIHKWEKPQ